MTRPALPDVTEPSPVSTLVPRATEWSELLFDQAPIGIGVAAVDGTLLAANVSLAAILGYERPSDIVGSSLNKFHAFPALAADILRERLEASGAQGVELDLVRSDGVDIAVSINARFLRNGPGGADTVVFSAEDITLERELRETSTQGQKMEAVVRFAGGVAHDYNNLLTSIIGEAQQLVADLSPGTDDADGARQIVESARRAGDITQRLLAFSRSDVSSTEVVDVNESLATIREAFENRLGGDVSLVLRLEEAVGNIRIDRSHLGQVLNNLLENACDAMPAGGRVVIETARASAPTDTEGIDFNPPVPPGRYISIAVGDNGIGMNAETRRRIFDPFFTTKPIGGGAGLGMTTVYGHVLRANGHISVLSAPAHGTLVRILLPIENNPTVAAREADPERDAEPQLSRRILVVDDEATVLRVMTKILRRAGYEVLQAPDAFAAQDIVRDSGGDLDLVVTDVMMPRMTGTELVQWLETHEPSLPVLMVSGYAENDLVQKWIDADPEVFLTKPFEPQELLTRVERRLLSS